MENKVFIIGIAGGTGSGKTTIAKQLQSISPQDILILSHDNYYKDRSNLPLEERKLLNYDEPAAIDEDLFVKQVEVLKRGEAVDMPLYDFSTHTRKSETVRVQPEKVVIIEGILILTDPRIRELLDLTIFIDVEPDVRLARRLMRDVGERDRSFEESLNQYLISAQPMYDKYVEPGKEYADFIVNNNGEMSDLEDTIQTIQARIQQVLGLC